MKVWSSQLWLRFKQSQLSPKNVFGASTGSEPMAPVLALQCFTNWAMKTHTLGAGQFVEFIVPVKGMKHMNIVRTADIQMVTPSFHLYVRSSHSIHMLWKSVRKVYSLSVSSRSLNYQTCVQQELQSFWYLWCTPSGALKCKLTWSKFVIFTSFAKWNQLKYVEVDVCLMYVSLFVHI